MGALNNHHRTFVIGAPVARKQKAEVCRPRPSTILAPLSVGLRTRRFLADQLDDYPAESSDLAELMVEDRR